MDNYQNYSTHDYTPFRCLNQIRLQVEADVDEIPLGFTDGELALLQIGNLCVHPCVVSTQDLYRSRRSIDRGHIPPSVREPDGVATRPAGEIQRSAGFQLLRGFDK
jgi:hypothetical protein